VQAFVQGADRTSAHSGKREKYWPITILSEALKTTAPAMAGDPITYREYKLLLRSENFIRPADFHEFWKLTRRAAKEVGIELRKRGHPLETHLREVLFFDTPEFHLYNHAFILRRRTFYKKGLPNTNHELMLKFRHHDRLIAAAVDVRPTPPHHYTIKFKEEVLMERAKIGGMRMIYSHGCELDTPDPATHSLDHTAQLFPALRRAGAPAGSVPGIVNEVAIEEILVNFGELEFDGKSARATLAIWRNRMTQQQLVGEYSYQLKFSDEAGFHGRAKDLSEAFFLTLQQQARDWLHFGTTKTAMVYGLGNTPVTNQE
jgi:hypothetical protein